MNGCLKHFSSRCVIHAIFLFEALYASGTAYDAINTPEDVEPRINPDYELNPDHILEEIDDPQTNDVFSSLINGPVTREALQKYYDIIASLNSGDLKEAKRLAISVIQPDEDDEETVPLMHPSQYLHQFIDSLVPDDSVIVHEITE